MIVCSFSNGDETSIDLSDDMEEYLVEELCQVTGIEHIYRGLSFSGFHKVLNDLQEGRKVRLIINDSTMRVFDLFLLERKWHFNRRLIRDLDLVAEYEYELVQ